MIELVTKQDLQANLQAVRQDLQATKLELQAAIHALGLRLDGRIDALQEAINTQTLRQTVRLGGIVVAGMAILAMPIGTMGLFLRLN
jgi:hypothetical protein